MKIEPAKYEEAYRCARKVHEGKMRVTDARDHLAAKGVNPNSALDFIYIFRHMLAGKIYKRAMSAEATDYFLENIRGDYGAGGLSNALAALAQHIPYKGGKMSGHRALLAKFGSSPKAATHLPPMVQVLPMSPNESDDMDIEEMQRDYFLSQLPHSRNGEFRCRTFLHAPQGSLILFQYLGCIVATAELRGRKIFNKPDKYGYTRAMVFAVSSIRTFVPLTANEVIQIWPKIQDLRRVKWNSIPNDSLLLKRYFKKYERLRWMRRKEMKKTPPGVVVMFRAARIQGGVFFGKFVNEEANNNSATTCASGIKNAAS